MFRSMLSSLLLALAAASTAQAETFTYRGYLEDGGGPAQGRYDLQLTLYADAQGTRLLSAPIELNDVAFSEGRFAVAVPVPMLPPTVDSGWLAVAVKSSYDSNYWPLSGKSQVDLRGGICPAAWALDGNAGTNPATHFVGTTDDVPLVLRSTVGVGINNSTPQVPLHVLNSAGTTSALFERSSNGDTGINIRTAESAPSAVASLRLQSGNTTNGFLQHFHNNTGGTLVARSVGQFAIRAGGNTTRLRVTETGNVGIGPNITPTARMEVAGSADSTDPVALFRTGSTTHLQIAADGAVGIGTSSPEAPLHVAPSDLDPTSPIARFRSPIFRSSFVSVETEGPNAAGINLSSGGNLKGSISVGGADAGLFVQSPLGEVHLMAGTGPDASRAVLRSNNTLSLFRGFTVVPAGRVIQVGTDTSNGNGAHLLNGGNWTNGSSRSFKHLFEEVDSLDVLDRLVALPVTRWSYHDADEIRHMGPVAEDFHAAFELGHDEKYISTVDASGVALAAIQGMNAKLETANAELRAELEALRRRQDEEVSALRQELAVVRHTQDTELVALRAELALMRDLLMPAVAHGGR